MKINIYTNIKKVFIINCYSYLYFYPDYILYYFKLNSFKSKRKL